MDTPQYVLRAVTTTCVALLVSACAAPGGAPLEPNSARSMHVEPEPTATNQLETKQPTVIGKFDVFRNGKQLMLAREYWNGIGPFSVLILPEGANQMLTLGTDVHGWFTWKLNPGAYRLRALTIGYGTNDAKSHGIGGRFTVAEEDAAVYIGHLTVDMSAAQLTVGFRDSEQDAIQELGKRDSQAAPPTKRLLEPEDKVGTYSRVRSVCANEWGVECSKILQGVEPISPALTRSIRGPTFTKVDNTTPELRWKPAPMPDISYDVGVWEAATYSVPQSGISGHMPGRLIVYEENLGTPALTLKTPLNRHTKYYWSVRLRKGDMVSSWSRAGHFAFLVVAWTASSGGWFGFETPK